MGEIYDMADKIETRKVALDKIGNMLNSRFITSEALRRDKELEWIQSLRQSKGIYDPEILAKIPVGKSQIYVKYTRSKEVPCVSKLFGMYFPHNDRNWSIEPTPDPKIPQEKIDEITRALFKQDQQTGETIPPDSNMVRKAISEFSTETNKRMMSVMDDQLFENGYKELTKKVVKSGVRYGTGIFKGAISKKKLRNTIIENSGEYIQEEEIEYYPYIEFLPIWNFYTDMTAIELKDCDFVFELNPMTKHELRQLANREDFFGDTILNYIKDNPSGNYKTRNWEIDIQNIGVKGQEQANAKKYEVKEFNGYIDGIDLQNAGIDIPDNVVNEEYFVNIWLLGEKVIKAKLNPFNSLNKLYHLFYFSKDETSIFGDGLPLAIRDTQTSINAATRAMQNHAARVAGPITEVNIDLLEEDEDPDDISPDRVFLRKGKGVDAQYQAIRSISIDSHIPEYLNMINKFESNGDMESTLPAFIYGEQVGTTNETARGMSMRQSNLNITFADLVKLLDAACESLLTSLYEWNMKFNPDKTIKGDMKVKASGSSSLMSRELRIQALDYFATTITQEDEPYIRRGDLLRERAKLHDLKPDDFIRSDVEAQQIIESQRDPELPQIAKDKERSEIEYTKSKAAHMLAKVEASKRNIDLDALATIQKTDGDTRKLDMEKMEQQRKLLFDERKYYIDLVNSLLDSMKTGDETKRGVS